MKSVIGLLVLALGSAPEAEDPARVRVRIVFGGVVHEMECPTVPTGQTMSWVNQNCTWIRQVGRMAPGKPGNETVITFNQEGIGELTTIKREEEPRRTP